VKLLVKKQNATSLITVLERSTIISMRLGSADRQRIQLCDELDDQDAH